MRGLKKQEDKKFENFFAFVQEKAWGKASVFFLECGEGRDFEDGDMEGEDMSGWLVPEDQAEQFQKDWEKGEEMDKWDKFFRFAKWSMDPLDVEFVEV